MLAMAGGAGWSAWFQPALIGGIPDQRCVPSHREQAIARQLAESKNFFSPSTENAGISAFLNAAGG
jgi:hypothetical protein